MEVKMAGGMEIGGDDGFGSEDGRGWHNDET
jgi:hypothetical protein